MIGRIRQAMTSLSRHGRKKVALYVLIGLLLPLSFGIGQLWMDRQAISRQEKGFARQQARQVLLAREGLEDRLRILIVQTAFLTVTSDYRPTKEALGALVRTHQDVLAGTCHMFGLEDIFSYRAPLSLGIKAQQLSRAVLDLALQQTGTEWGAVRTRPIRVVEGHPLLPILTDIHSPEGEPLGKLAVVLDLLPAIHRYVVPLTSGRLGGAYFLDSRGKIIYHHQPSLIGQNISSFLAEGGLDWRTIREESSGNSVIMERFGPGAPERKLASWITVRFLDQRFTLILATPEQDVIASIQDYRETRLLLVVFMLISSILVIHRSIAQNHQASLRTSEARYQAIIDEQFELVARYAPDGTFTFVNDAYCRFFGVTSKEVIGLSLATVRDEKTFESCLRLFNIITPTAPMNLNEERTERTDGQVRYLSWTNRGVFDSSGSLLEIQCVARDITEQKEFELALQDETMHLENIHGIAHQLTSAKTERDLLTILVRSLNTSMGYRNASVTLQPQENEAALSVRVDPSEPPDETWEAQALESGYPATGSLGGSRCQVSIPLVFQDQVRGVISVESAEHPKGREVRRLSILADYSAGILELLRVMEKRTQEALIDPLTMLWNRRYILQLLETEGDRIRRYGETACLVLIDLGDFKTINDRHGHAAGDRALIDVAAILQSSVRSCDMVGRYGGDEFLIYLPHTTLDQARIVLERAAHNMAAHGFPSPIALDYGIAGFPDDGDNTESVIKVADDRMYRAKARRKSRKEGAS